MLVLFVKKERRTAAALPGKCFRRNAGKAIPVAGWSFGASEKLSQPGRDAPEALKTPPRARMPPRSPSKSIPAPGQIFGVSKKAFPPWEELSESAKTRTGAGMGRQGLGSFISRQSSGTTRHVQGGGDPLLTRGAI